LHRSFATAVGNRNPPADSGEMSGQQSSPVSRESRVDGTRPGEQRESLDSATTHADSSSDYWAWTNSNRNTSKLSQNNAKSSSTAENIPKCTGRSALWRSLLSSCAALSISFIGKYGMPRARMGNYAVPGAGFIRYCPQNQALPGQTLYAAKSPQRPYVCLLLRYS